ncbi:Uncharacterised protein [Mycobacteroides abscessus]|nr:Uncharacterised protein [Mycobacteroides abscessus]
MDRVIGAAATAIGTLSARISAADGFTNAATSSIAWGRPGHCTAHERVSSAASHAGLLACIAAVTAASPSERKDSAVTRADTEAGESSGAPVHAGIAASTATVASGFCNAHVRATAVPMETPPTTMGPS